jgi:hypothetical protein
MGYHLHASDTKANFTVSLVLPTSFMMSFSATSKGAAYRQYLKEGLHYLWQLDYTSAELQTEQLLFFTIYLVLVFLGILL